MCAVAHQLFWKYNTSRPDQSGSVFGSMDKSANTCLMGCDGEKPADIHC